MLNFAKTPRILRQTNVSILYDVSSRTRQDTSHKLTIMEGDEYHCTCEAFRFGRVCRHAKMTRMKMYVGENLPLALGRLEDKTLKPYVAWDAITCMQPKEYDAKKLNCSWCKLYPEYCNIHPIHYKRNAKPLVWRIHTELMRGKRKTAAKMLRTYIKAVQYFTGEKR